MKNCRGESMFESVI